jgi:uncharacterized protein (TIGR02145 family)
MIINKDWKFYKQSLIELTNEEILKLLNSKQKKKLELEFEEYNFKINSDNWKSKIIDWEKVKINPEWDITEFLIWDYKGEQLFTWNACIRETEKRNKRVPTEEEFNIILKTKEDFKNNKLAGNRNTDGVTFSNRGYGTYLWSSTAFDATNAYNRYLDYDISAVYRGNDNKTNGFSVRCLKD